MLIPIPVSILLDLELTADEYTICYLIYDKKYGLLLKYNKLIGDRFNEILVKLKNKQYISYNSLGNTIDIRAIEVTDTFIKLLSGNDSFEEFHYTFPTKVRRPEGEEDYLRINKAKCKLKYRRVVRDSKPMADHLLKCLKFEIKRRRNNGTLGYFKRMYNWLETEEWKRYEDKIAELQTSNPEPKRAPFSRARRM